MSRQGAIIISLDFELNWGVHDLIELEQYKENLLGVREAIPKMLELFQQYDIHATWATVGMLYFESKHELLNSLPPLKPSYTNRDFSPYTKLDSIGESEQQDPFHFGRSLLEKIEQCPNQELATHTFSHYYCLEEGQSLAEFESDIIAALEAAKANDHVLKSLVFPRNQTNRDYLLVCKKHGIKSYRGNEDNWVYKASRFHSEGNLKRMFRLLDSYINIYGHHTYPIAEVDTNPIVNLPSSRFLRPFISSLKLLEPLRLRRIKRSLLYAAQKGEMYHLWWHPHNFGKNVDENIQFLKEILQFVTKLRHEYDFKSLTMEEAAAFVLKLNEERAIHNVP